MNQRSIFAGIGAVCALTVSLAFARPSAPSAPPIARVIARVIAPGAADTFAIDPVHSNVLFRIKRMDVSWFYGRFDGISGSITLDAAKPESSKVNVEVKIASVDTGDGKRDAHLKSPDFFDAKQFPTATFTSKSVKAAGDKKYSVTGDLTLHGVTKPVTIEVESVGKGKGFPDGEIAGFLGTVTIKRSDFGMSFSLDALGDEVQLTLSLLGEKK
jgi:polyisoprenoid-binding protein YceI